jgi:hypothetical protein
MPGLPKSIVPDVAPRLFRAYQQLGQFDRADEMAMLYRDRRAGRNAEVVNAVFRQDRDALRTVLARNCPAVGDCLGVASSYVWAGRLGEARLALALIRAGEADPPRRSFRRASVFHHVGRSVGRGRRPLGCRHRIA